MTMKKTIRIGVYLAVSVGGLALSACSTNTASSRYGDVNNGCCVETATCVGVVDCGYWVTPLHHVQTIEKEVVVEKEVIKQLPPVTIYEPAPCPADTRPDANGACIRTVTVEVPIYMPPECPEGTIPGYGGNGCIPIVVPRK